MKIPASKVPAQVWADKAMRRADLDEVESMLLSSWNDSKQVYRIGKELWDELRIDEADEVPVDALLRLPYGCIFIERRWVDEYEQLLTDDMADTWGEASCYVTRYYEGCFCWVEGAGYLPRQTPDYIPGADGMWYNTAGQGFNPNVVPSYVADTYTAYNPALQRPVSLSESPV